MQYDAACMHMYTWSVKNNHFYSSGNVFIKSSDASEHLSTIFQYHFEFVSFLVFIHEYIKKTVARK